MTSSAERAQQHWPAVAAGKQSYLVVWQEGLAVAGAKETTIYGMRVSVEGKPLDREPLAICSAKSFQCYPAVTFDGANFVVAWQDFRSGRDWDLFAARVTPSGKLLDKDGFAVAALPGNQIYPALAADGATTLCVFSDLRPQTKLPEAYALSATRLPQGAAEAGEVKLLAPHYDQTAQRVRSHLTPAVVFDGRRYVVAAQYAPSDWIYGAPLLLSVSPDGAATRLPGGFLTPGFSIAAAASQGRVIMFSTQKTEHWSYNVRYMSSLFDVRQEQQKNMMVLGLQSNFAPRNDMASAVVFDGTSFVAVVEQFPDFEQRAKEGAPIVAQLYAMRFDPASGRPLDAKFEEAPADAWRDLRPYGRQKELHRPTAAIAVTRDDVPSRHPALASFGNGKSLVVYSRHAGALRTHIFANVLEE